MHVFLFFASIAWLVVVTLIVAEGRTRIRPTGDYRRYRIGGAIIVFNPRVARNLALGLAACALLLIAVATIGQVARTGYLYSTYDFFTSRYFGKCVLGLVFGSLLASWMMRVYRGASRRAAMSAEQAMPLPQKVEGIALLFLFVVGSTNISIEDMLRGFAYDKDGVRFTLASAATTGIPTSFGKGAAVLEPSSSETKSAVQTGDNNGLSMLGNLAEFMERDADYIAADTTAELAGIEDKNAEKDRYADLVAQKTMTSQLKAAAQFYRTRFTGLAACMAEIGSITGDLVYVQQQLRATKAALRELFMLSLAEHGGAPERMVPAAQTLNYRLGILTRKIAAHADALRDGVGAVRLTVRRQEGFSAEGASDALEACAGLPMAYADASTARNQAVAAGGYADRPYLAVAYSAVLLLEEQELAGVDALSDWLTVQERVVKEQKAYSQDQIVRRWYEIRVLSMQYLLFQDLFERAPSQPELLRDRFITVIERMQEVLSRTSFVRTGYAQVFEPALDLVGTKFERDMDAARDCTASDLNVRVNFSLLSAKLNYVQAVLGHSALLDRHVPRAREEIKNVVNANVACIKKIFGSEYVAMFRAEALMLYARLLSTEIAARQPISEGYGDATRLDLNTVRSALILARSLIDDLGSPKREDSGAIRVSQLAWKSRYRALLDQINVLLAENLRWSEQLSLN